MSFPPSAATVVDSKSQLSWGPVKDAFARRDKLVIASGTAHGAAAWVMELAAATTANATNENVAPAAEATKSAAKPEEPPAPVDAAPAPVAASAPLAVAAPVTLAANTIAAAAAAAPEPVEEAPQPLPVTEKVKKEAKQGSRERERASHKDHKPSGRSGSAKVSRRSDPPALAPTAAPAPVAAAASAAVVAPTAAASIGSVPSQRDKALGLRAVEFRGAVKAIKSDADALALINGDHGNMMATLVTRKTHVAAVRGFWSKDNVGRAVAQMHDARELSVVYDVLGNLNAR